MKICNNCKNRGMKRRCDLYTSMSTYAEKCKDFEEKKQTNADRIRSMSDEELADFIEMKQFFALANNGTDGEEYTLKWLQSEVEVDNLD